MPAMLGLACMAVFQIALRAKVSQRSVTQRANTGCATQDVNCASVGQCLRRYLGSRLLRLNRRLRLIGRYGNLYGYVSDVTAALWVIVGLAVTGKAGFVLNHAVFGSGNFNPVLFAHLLARYNRAKVGGNSTGRRTADQLNASGQCVGQRGLSHVIVTTSVSHSVVTDQNSVAQYVARFGCRSVCDVISIAHSALHGLILDVFDDNALWMPGKSWGSNQGCRYHTCTQHTG